jgi:hypothetical protein
LAVSNAVLEPTLDALISIDNLALEAVPLIRNEPLRIAKGAFSLTAHSRHCEEVVSHDCESGIELLATLTSPPQWLHLFVYDLSYGIQCCSCEIQSVTHVTLELNLLHLARVFSLLLRARRPFAKGRCPQEIVFILTYK